MGCGASSKPKYEKESTGSSVGSSQKDFQIKESLQVGDRLSDVEKAKPHWSSKPKREEAQTPAAKDDLLLDTTKDQRIDTIKKDTKGDGRFDTMMQDTTGDGKMNKIL